MKRLMILVLGGVVGCGAPAPQFTDEAEELRYLTTLSSPTVDQFRRKEVLAIQAKQRQDALDEAARKRAEEEQARLEIRRAKLDALAKVKEAERERQDKAAEILKSARLSEKTGNLGLAKNAYQRILDDFRDLPEAKEAAEGLVRVAK